MTWLILTNGVIIKINMTCSRHLNRRFFHEYSNSSEPRGLNNKCRSNSLAPKRPIIIYEDEVNEGNVGPHVSSGISSPPSATAALSQSQGLASPSAPLSPIEDGGAKKEAEEECCGEREGFEPRPGAESAVAHIRLQLWDRRPVRGTPFRAKAEIRFHNYHVTSFINFTKSRKWYGKRQDQKPENEFWYAFYRDIGRALEQEYDGDPAYRPRIGHMIRRPAYGKAQEQLFQFGGILRWEDGGPRITLMINDYIWALPMQKSKNTPGPKTPGWYAYYQPKNEEEEDEEYL